MIMNGYEYENLVVDYLKSNGYIFVSNTKKSKDYGVDVTAFKDGNKYAVQCKYYSKPVGIKAVQEVVAGSAYYNCNKMMVVTNNTFTDAAKKLADANNVILIPNVTNSNKNIFAMNSLLKLVIYFVMFGIFLKIINFFATSIGNILNEKMIIPQLSPILLIALFFSFKSMKFGFFDFLRIKIPKIILLSVLSFFFGLYLSYNAISIVHIIIAIIFIAISILIKHLLKRNAEKYAELCNNSDEETARKDC